MYVNLRIVTAWLFNARQESGHFLPSRHRGDQPVPGPALRVALAILGAAAAFTLLTIAAGAVLAQQQKPKAADVAAVGELEVAGGESTFFAVWVEPAGGEGESTVAVAERDSYFRGTIEDVKLVGGAAMLEGKGVLRTGETAAEVAFKARLARGNPDTFSITYHEKDGRPVKTVEGRVSKGEVEMR